MSRLNIPKISQIGKVFFAIIAIAIIVATIVTLVRVVVLNKNDDSSAELDAGRTALLSSSAGRSVRMTVRGNIVGDESFRSYRIEISPTSRTLDKMSGYMEQTTNLVLKTNNISAYEQFVNALDKANFMKGEQFDEENNDIRGICATGYVYDFELIYYGSVEKNLWTSSCAGSKGSLAANLQQVYNLFSAQIPDSKKLISEIWR